MADGNAFKENVIGSQLNIFKHILRFVIALTAIALLIVSITNYDSDVDVNGNLVAGGNSNTDNKNTFTVPAGVMTGIICVGSFVLSILIYNSSTLKNKKIFDENISFTVVTTLLWGILALVSGALILNWVINYVGFGNRNNNDKAYKYGFLAGVLLIVYGLMELVYLTFIFLQKRKSFVFTSKYLDYTFGGIIVLILFANFFTSLLGYLKYDDQAYSRFATSGGTPTKIGRQTWYKLSSDNNIDGKNDALIGMSLSIGSFVTFTVLFFYYIYLNYISSRDADIKLSATGNVLIFFVCIFNLAAGIFLFRAATDYEDLDERTDQQVDSHMLCNISGVLMISSSIFILLLLFLIKYIRYNKGLGFMGFGETKEAKEAYNNYIEKMNKEKASSGTRSSSDTSSSGDSKPGELTQNQIMKVTSELKDDIEKYMKTGTGDPSEIGKKFKSAKLKGYFQVGNLDKALITKYKELKNDINSQGRKIEDLDYLAG